MIGNPKFKREDLVSFTVPVNGVDTKLDGAIYVVDANGTYEQHEEPSYDIESFLDGEVALFKHVRESWVTKRAE